MSIDDILGLPKKHDDVKHIYPVKLHNSDEFYSCYHFLMLSIKHFGFDDEDESIKDIGLLRLLTLYYIKEYKVDEKIKEQFDKMAKLFSIVLHDDMNYIVHDNSLVFFNKNQDKIINNNNYEEIRKIIMEQNLLFEEKIYKDPLVQKWARKALEAKQKGNNITDETMVTIISVISGKSYEEIANMTLYQYKAEFYRIMAIMNYETSVIFATVAGSEGQMPHYTDDTDFNKNPYDGLFKKGGSLLDKLTGSV